MPSVYYKQGFADALVSHDNQEWKLNGQDRAVDLMVAGCCLPALPAGNGLATVLHRAEPDPGPSWPDPNPARAQSLWWLPGARAFVSRLVFVCCLSWVLAWVTHAMGVSHWVGYTRGSVGGQLAPNPLLAAAPFPPAPPPHPPAAQFGAAATALQASSTPG